MYAIPVFFIVFGPECSCKYWLRLPRPVRTSSKLIFPRRCSHVAFTIIVDRHWRTESSKAVLLLIFFTEGFSMPQNPMRSPPISSGIKTKFLIFCLWKNACNWASRARIPSMSSIITHSLLPYRDHSRWKLSNLTLLALIPTGSCGACHSLAEINSFPASKNKYTRSASVYSPTCSSKEPRASFKSSVLFRSLRQALVVCSASSAPCILTCSFSCSLMSVATCKRAFLPPQYISLSRKIKCLSNFLLRNFQVNILLNDSRSLIQKEQGLSRPWSNWKHLALLLSSIPYFSFPAELMYKISYVSVSTT